MTIVVDARQDSTQMLYQCIATVKCKKRRTRNVRHVHGPYLIGAVDRKRRQQIRIDDVPAAFRKCWACGTALWGRAAASVWSLASGRPRRSKRLPTNDGSEMEQARTLAGLEPKTKVADRRGVRISGLNQGWY
ncbi:hypothetical protein [Pseudoxanthomonas sp. UTMC 1351]|uniref:hypothetical protein n=1 Tax=Pseudoxanthomonas sp. UTMC 1351 TaxID=2695853 RepID=UPI0034CE871B